MKVHILRALKINLLLGIVVFGLGYAAAIWYPHTFTFEEALRIGLYFFGLGFLIDVSRLRKPGPIQTRVMQGIKLGLVVSVWFFLVAWSIGYITSAWRVFLPLEQLLAVSLAVFFVCFTVGMVRYKQHLS